MTDEQILNALRSCGDGIAICDDCVYYGKAHCSILAKQDIIARFEELLAENSELKSRLEKAVELPCKPGDTVFMPWVWGEQSGIAKLTIDCVTLFRGESLYDTDLQSDDLYFKSKYSFGQFRDYDFGERVFTDREAAEAKLKELK